MKKTFIFLFGLLMLVVNSQVTTAQSVGINNTGAAPNNSAMLDVSSTSKGLLIPRMTTSQRLSISSPATGLIVYQTDGDYGFHFYDGASWVKLNTESPVWSDEGSYLSPLGAIGPGLKVANDETYQYGFYSEMNTGSATGYGGYFSHTNANGATYGLFASSSFTGSNNNSYSYGAYIFSSSSVQDQKGIYNYNLHTGTSGYLIGIENYSQLPTGNSTQLTGIKNVSVRDGTENIHYGIYSQAVRGTNVYGVYGLATTGTSNYGLYGVAETATNSYGLYARGESWGGWLAHNSSGNSVKLGGSSVAIQIQDGNEADGKVLASDEFGNASWQSMPWTDNGNYLSPTNPNSLGISVADDTTYSYGFRANMNTGASDGYGGYFTHENSNNNGTGVYVSSTFTGTNNIGTTKGIDVYTNSTTQNQIGISNFLTHTGSTGNVTGMITSANMAAGNYGYLVGLHVSTGRAANEGSNYAVDALVNGGSTAIGLNGAALLGENNYGVYGRAEDGTLCIGVFGEGEDWGGVFENMQLTRKVKLGGYDYAIQITDGTQGPGKVLTSDVDGNGSWQNAVSPGGWGGCIQFNDNNSFGGNISLVWDNVNERMGIGVTPSSARLEVSGDIKLSNISDALEISNYIVFHTPGNSDNISVGASSGSAVAGGRHNAFFGFESGLSITGGWDNTLLGYKSGRLATNAQRNTFVGGFAGSNQLDGDNNTFLGYHSGSSTNSPDNNTFVGAYSGYNTVTGSGNIFLGYQAGYNESGSNKLYIHNSSSATPLIYGDFYDEKVRINGDLGVKTIPLTTANFHVDGDELYAGYFTSNAADENTHIIHAEYDGTGLEDVIAVYGEATMPSPSQGYGIGGAFIGNYYGAYAISNAEGSSFSSFGLFAENIGLVGTRYGAVGSVYGNEDEELYALYGAAPVQNNSYALYCDGDGVYTGSWGSASDKELKKNISQISNALDLIKQLRPRSYEFKTDEFEFMNLARGNHFGFIAQEMEYVLPELVGTARQPMSINKNTEMFEFKTTNTIELIPILTKAIQEQQAVIEDLQRQVSLLMEERE